MARVVVGMSGGVDSSVAAARLREAGHEVLGVTLRHCPEERPGLDYCGSPDAIADARRVCGALGIEHRVADTSRAFEASVAGPFVEAYLGGRTPNPCVECNPAVKFAALLSAADEWGGGPGAAALGGRSSSAPGEGGTLIATGHYARVLRGSDGFFRLLKGADPRKDQAYFLHRLAQRQLSRTLFPLGDSTKTEVRSEAARRGLPTASKRDSQDVCFIPDRDYAAFIRARGGRVEPGEIRDTAGRALGRHRGLACYTVGQRRGLGLASREPLYVVRLEPATNTLVVGGEAETAARRFRVVRPSWVCGRFPETRTLGTRIRHRAAVAPCRARELPDGLEVELAEPRAAVAPGQAAVFYDGEEVLGGGTIQEVLT